MRDVRRKTHFDPEPIKLEGKEKGSEEGEPDTSKDAEIARKLAESYVTPGIFAYSDADFVPEKGNVEVPKSATEITFEYVDKMTSEEMARLPAGTLGKLSNAQREH